MPDGPQAEVRDTPTLTGSAYLWLAEGTRLTSPVCFSPRACGTLAAGSPTPQGQKVRVTVSSHHCWRTNMTMATIGTFTTSESGFNGSIRTLALNVKARIARIENPSDRGPHFRIYAGNVELGAAWQKRSAETDRDYLSVKLDDPSFPAPIYATLSEVEGEDGFQLIWSRPNRD